MSDQPETNRIILDKPLELRVTDPLAVQIAVAKNSAENGRCFCWLLAFICVFASMTLHRPEFLHLAVLSALPIGLASILDRLSAGRLQSAAAIALQAYTAAIVILIIIAIG